ncbi:hypothetical protein BCR42DRAFT_427103 [Absidia repens]|uniref:Uncharacterized protein n=1 Tax=Absidia repens TaxID=90262 RepID=A0A1X2HZW0_9FUNG|nr:hypothetical protein BCR42DRAFT_427103 [Absidia repens]
MYVWSVVTRKGSSSGIRYGYVLVYIIFDEQYILQVSIIVIVAAWPSGRFIKKWAARIIRCGWRWAWIRLGILWMRCRSLSFVPRITTTTI